MRYGNLLTVDKHQACEEDHDRSISIGVSTLIPQAKRTVQVSRHNAPRTAKTQEQDEMWIIMNELSQPSFSAAGMLQRTALCERALTLLQHQNPTLEAALENELGDSLMESRLGRRVDNVERAIAAYRVALSNWDRNLFPEQWAATQNNLGIAYCDRVVGNRAENIEQAISAFEMALHVYTCTDFPEAWAATQNNLGTAYFDRSFGQRADNIEKAISAYLRALQVYTRADFPEQWAATQNNLGTAYLERLVGDQVENRRRAVVAYELALQIYTRTMFPAQHRTIQHNLMRAKRPVFTSGDGHSNVKFVSARV